MDKVELIRLALEVVGAIASVAIPILARRHAALAAALQQVLDAVQQAGHAPTARAVAEVDHPDVQNHEVSQ